MTVGQERALRELGRLSAADSAAFDLVHEPFLSEGRLVATIGITLGAIESREGGLDLREREEFVLVIPGGFPFDRPGIVVAHNRFAGFAHVTWGKSICLYQSSVEWNPSDGLYGLFDRLKMWLAKAAINDMDPIDGPLEPPHQVTDFNQKPFVIRANAPCAAGDSWAGVAVLNKHANRTELIAWDDLSGEWPKEGELAFAVMMPDSISMEFPANGKELFREIEKAGMQRERIVRNLALAAFLSTEGEPIHLVLGLPMRRAADGTRKLHIAVWSTDAARAKSLRSVLATDADTEELKTLRVELGNALLDVFELSQIAWCQVFEDRDEIVVRRDCGTPFAWFAGKKALVLGCGALGSWAAEMIARAKPNVIHLVDNGFVKPGILARQDFELNDIGATKADALARRIGAIEQGCSVVSFGREAHAFLLENPERLRDYDIVLDCTASSILQMKIERDWRTFSNHMPVLVSLVIDSQSKHCLCVVVPRANTGGVWDAYITLKQHICMEGQRLPVVTAFYSERSSERLFQPEPGCSDPTFVGSMADVVCLLSGAFNVAVKRVQECKSSLGIILSAPETTAERSLDCIELPEFCEVGAGTYRVRIAKAALAQAKSWVKKNNRVRSSKNETGGLLWGIWDDATQVIWIFEVSGPPPDSKHSPALFVCGVEGTKEEHHRRFSQSHGTNGFVGHWHTHPDLPSTQSGKDISTMATLVSSIGLNQKRSVMLIFGRTRGNASAGVYVYESQSIRGNIEQITAGVGQISLESRVV